MRRTPLGDRWIGKGSNGAREESTGDGERRGNGEKREGRERLVGGGGNNLPRYRRAESAAVEVDASDIPVQGGLVLPLYAPRARSHDTLIGVPPNRDQVHEVPG